MMKKLFLYAALMCLVALALGEPVTLKGSKTSVTIDPAGATITIYKTGDSSVWTHTFTQIQEIASDGGVVNAVNSFGGITFNAPPPQEQNFQGVNATMVMVNGNVPVSGTSGTSTSASLSARLYVFNEPGKINYGAKSYDVDVNSVEIVYSIAGWPVASTNNTLNLRVRIATPGRTGSWKNPELRLSDGAVVVFSSQATSSSGQQNVVVDAVNGNSAVDINIEFQAANTIDYDPLFTLQAVSAAASLRPFFLSLFF